MQTISFRTVLTQCLFLISVVAAVNYCGPKFCNNSKQHTLCRFQSPSPSSQCTEYEATIIGDQQKQGLLDKINSRRNKIASGDVRSFPAAENMMKLVWNEDLEKSAQRWADQCVEQNTPEYEMDTCRDLSNNSAVILVGQIIASVYGEAQGLSPLSLVDVWYMELLNANSSMVTRYRPSSMRGFSHYDYFTQLAWARSSEVGCGGVKFKELLKPPKSGRSRTVHRLVCNFAPTGNILDESVYELGPPCSKCPIGARCDLFYNSLCSNTATSTITSDEPEANVTDKLIKVERSNKSSDDPNAEDGNSGLYDYFSEIYGSRRESETTVTTQSVIPCKDAMAVDEFVELLKKKLTTDPMFRELLSTKSSTQNGNIDSSFTDPNVEAFVSRVYSKKELTTTTKLPEQDYVNSTLLVDLVEAVIFRSGGKTYVTEESIETLPPQTSEINPVKIQAELAEIKLNNDFTGHYFFPEDSNEESVHETTDTYYDASYLPVSDVVSEIENLKRDKESHDFLDDILNSDTENDENNGRRRKRSGRKKIENEYFSDNNYHDTKQEKTCVQSGDYYCNNIEYRDLLRKLASDFKLLKLNERFHCSCLRNYAVKIEVTIFSFIALISIYWNYTL